MLASVEVQISAAQLWADVPDVAPSDEQVPPAAPPSA